MPVITLKPITELCIGYVKYLGHGAAENAYINIKYKKSTPHSSQGSHPFTDTPHTASNWSSVASSPSTTPNLNLILTGKMVQYGTREVEPSYNPHGPVPTAPPQACSTHPSILAVSTFIVKATIVEATIVEATIVEATIVEATIVSGSKVSCSTSKVIISNDNVVVA